MTSSRLRVSLLDRAASQWAALGVAVHAPREPAVVDLEALIGLTVAVGQDDPRVWDGGVAWCGRYGRFVNTARLRRAIHEMRVPPDRLEAFAIAARRAGAPRWSMGSPAASPTPSPGDRELVVARPGNDAARLLWSIRAAFGVNARADIATNLVSRPGPWLTVRQLADLSRFAKRSAALALDDLVLAGVVERLATGSSGRYCLRDAPALLKWLDVSGPVDYPDWVAEFTVGLGIMHVADEPRDSERVRAIEMRQVVAGLQSSIDQSGIGGPDLRVMGPAFAGAFDAWVDLLAERWSPRG